MSKKLLRLYIVGHTPSAKSAVDAIERLFEDTLKDEWSLEVIDVVENPEMAEQDLISAVPALVRTVPPKKRAVGDLTDVNLIIQSLGLLE